jgi:hypothetical protein
LDGLIVLRRQLAKLLNGTLLVKLVSILHSRLSVEKELAGA